MKSVLHARFFEFPMSAANRISCLVKLSLACLAFLYGVPVTFAENVTGLELHATKCMACHSNMVGGDGSVLYTRPTRRVNSYQELQIQVKFCETTLNLEWSVDEVAAVIEYLNHTYYHFED